MHELNSLKDMLVKELEEFGKSGQLSKASLDTIDKLAHATKNLVKVIECCEADEYSHRMGRSYAERGYSYRDGEHSYANDNLRGQLYKLMESSNDERTRDKLREFIDRV